MAQITCEFLFRLRRQRARETLYKELRRSGESVRVSNSRSFSCSVQFAKWERPRSEEAGARDRRRDIRDEEAHGATSPETVVPRPGSNTPPTTHKTWHRLDYHCTLLQRG